MKRPLFICISFLFHTTNHAMSRILTRVNQIPYSHNVQYIPSSNALAHHCAITECVKEHIDQLYAAINFLKSGDAKEAGTACAKSSHALEGLGILLDPTKINHGPILNSFACELATGMRYLQAELSFSIRALQNGSFSDHESIIKHLEQLNVLRQKFFAAFMQWDERLIDAGKKVHILETTIESMATANSVNNPRVINWIHTLRGGTYEYTLDLSQIQRLQDLLEDLVKVIIDLNEKCSKHEQAAQLVDKINKIVCDETVCKYANLGDFKRQIESVKKELQRLNRLLLKVQWSEDSLGESKLLSRLAEFEKIDLFSYQDSLLTSINQTAADLVVQTMQGALSVSDDIYGKIQTMGKLCDQLASATREGGTFEKTINGGIDLAQTLKDEKAVIQAIATKVHDWNIEEIVGLSNLMQNLALLAQDIAQDGTTTWSAFLYKLNPDLHAFLRSCKKENVQDALRAAQEIAKDFKLKQPLSKIALICARHGSTIKLGLQGLKVVMHQSAPLFEAYGKNLHASAQTLGEVNNTLHAKGQGILLASLTAYDIACALQTVADAHKKSDIYRKRDGVEEFEIELKNADQEAKNIDVSQVYEELGKLQNELLTIGHQLQQSGFSKSKRDVLELEYESTTNKYETEFKKLQRALDGLEFRRIGKYEPFCSSASTFHEYKQLAMLKHNQMMIEKNKKNFELRIREAEMDLSYLWGPFHKNVTTVVVYLWKYFTYLNYWLKKRTIVKKIELLQYQKNAWAQLEIENKKMHSELLQKISVDATCKAYFKALHPELFAVL